MYSVGVVKNAIPLCSTLTEFSPPQRSSNRTMSVCLSAMYVCMLHVSLILYFSGETPKTSLRMWKSFNTVFFIVFQWSWGDSWATSSNCHCFATRVCSLVAHNPPPGPQEHEKIGRAPNNWNQRALHVHLTATYSSAIRDNNHDGLSFSFVPVSFDSASWLFLASAIYSRSIFWTWTEQLGCVPHLDHCACAGRMTYRAVIARSWKNTVQQL